MKQFFLLILILGTTSIWGRGQEPVAANSPNIIFILADDLGYGDIGCYGQQKIKTPNIDALAKKGIRFTQFYSGSSVCAPARASLMTGLHTGHVSVRGNRGFEPEGQVPLPENDVTIAMELEKAGYATAAFGKWSLGFLTTSGAPSKKGIKTYFGYNCQSLAHNYFPDHLWENEKKIDFPENQSKPAVYSADLIHQRALQYLEDQKDNQPFFLYLPYTLPHADLTVPHDSVYDHYVKLFKEKPLEATDNRNKNKHFIELYPHAAYAAMVSRLDKYVGEIQALVEKKGIAGNTLIIFTSDNGPHREKGGDPGFFNNNGIFRGIKRDLYEGGIRVPLIISWQGKIKPGQETDHVGAFWDFFPSFQQLAGLAAQKNTDGISLLPTLFNKTQPRHEYLYWEFHEMGGRQALRWQNWKAVRLNVSTGGNVETELYDLASDPTEKVNVAVKNKEIVKKMEKFMEEAHIKNNDWPLFPSEK